MTPRRITKVALSGVHYTRALTPEIVVPSCLVPPEVVVAGSPRSHLSVVAVSVALGLTVHPVAVSKLSKKMVTGGGVPPSTALPVTTSANGCGPLGTLKERTVTV
jgi:hypothetical protein